MGVEKYGNDSSTSTSRDPFDVAERSREALKAHVPVDNPYASEGSEVSLAAIRNGYLRLTCNRPSTSWTYSQSYQSTGRSLLISGSDWDFDLDGPGLLYC